MAITITLGRKKPPGVDLGSGWMKVVSLGVRRRKPFLEKLSRSPLPLMDGDRPEKTANRLTELWRSLGIKERSVITAMTGHAVIIKRMTIPAEAARDMNAYLAREARQHIPFDLQDVYMDHQIFGPGAKDGTLDMVLVASKKKEVEERLKILTRAGLETMVMDVDAFALNNCFAYNYPELLDEPQYLLDIGGQLSLFCVVQQGQVIFHRELSLGGQQLTDRLVRAMDKSRLECEKLKINGPGDLPENQRAALQMEINGGVSAWCSEVRRLIDFFVNSAPDAAPGKNLFLSGGGSLLAGLNEIMASELQIKVNQLDPWRNLETDANQFDSSYLRAVGPQFAVAAGLALREALT